MGGGVDDPPMAYWDDMFPSRTSKGVVLPSTRYHLAPAAVKNEVATITARV